MLASKKRDELMRRCEEMQAAMTHFWPAAAKYKLVDCKTGIRAMPKSAADTRLVDVVQQGSNRLRVRAGKIDAIFDAERQVKTIIEGPKVRVTHTKIIEAI